MFGESATDHKMLQIKQQERCATHFEACFVMLPLPHINLPSVGACSSNRWALHFPTHPSLITGHQVFYLPAKGGIVVAGQEKYLASQSLRQSSPAACAPSLSRTPCTAGSSEPLPALEINSPVSQRTIHPGQLGGSLVYTFPWCSWLLLCRLIAGFIKWAGCTGSDWWQSIKSTHVEQTPVLFNSSQNTLNHRFVIMTLCDGL